VEDKLDRQKEITAQFSGTIAELSRDLADLTAERQSLFDAKSSLSSQVETHKAEADDLKVRAPASLQGRGREGYEPQGGLSFGFCISAHSHHLQGGRQPAVICGLCEASALCAWWHKPPADGQMLTRMVGHPVAQEALQRMKGQLVKEEQAVAAMQRAREKFLEAWLLPSRRRSNAARTIQRYFRAAMLRKLQQKNSLDVKVSQAAL
jgi:hypothetical protein